MARKTFISYKYSDAREVRDRIINSLGEDAKFYQGETSESPDMKDLKTETIVRNLSDMIFSTSVTIVVVSPEMLESKWIPWEIEYSLSCYSRDGIQSHQNGIVAVVKKVNGSYDWIQSKSFDYDKHMNVVSYDEAKLPQIIAENMYNSRPKKLACKNCSKYNGYSQCAECNTFESVYGSYITMIEEDVFLQNPQRYIEQAYDKSQSLNDYFTTKQIKKSA